MALARVKYTQSTSGNRNFTVTFPYISRDHVKVSVNDQPVSFTWTNNATVILDTAPLLGDIVDVYRVTERNNLLVDFNDGSTLTESQLQLSASQAFYIAQEAFDVSNTALSTAFDDMYFAGGRRIKGLGDAVEDQDAYTKGQADERFANDVITRANGHWNAELQQIRNLQTRQPPSSTDAMNFGAVSKHVSDVLNEADPQVDGWQRVRWVDTNADLQALPTSELVDGQPVLVGGGGHYRYSASKGGMYPASQGLGYHKVGEEVKAHGASIPLLPIWEPGHDGQAVHPSVIKIPGGFGPQQFVYWMAVTPYSSFSTENPWIFGSLDGAKWVSPEGVTQPLVPSPANGYNSDPVILHVDDQLWYFFRDTLDSPASDSLYLMKSSDGASWSTPQLIITSDGTDRLLSPAIIFDGDQFVMWSGRQRGDLVRRTSTDGVTWSAPVSVTFRNPLGNHQSATSHQSVIKCNGRLEMLLNTGFNDGNRLFFCTSYDEGASFDVVNEFIKPVHSFEQRTLYHGCLVPSSPIESDTYEVWYSARSNHDGWTVARTAARLSHDGLVPIYDDGPVAHYGSLTATAGHFTSITVSDGLAVTAAVVSDRQSADGVTRNARAVIAGEGKASGEASAVIASRTTNAGTRSEASGKQSFVAASVGATASGDTSATIASIDNSDASGPASIVLASSSSTASGHRTAVIASSIDSDATGTDSAAIATRTSVASGFRSCVLASDTSIASQRNSSVIASRDSHATDQCNFIASSDGCSTSGWRSAIISSSNVINDSPSTIAMGFSTQEASVANQSIRFESSGGRIRAQNTTIQGLDYAELFENATGSEIEPGVIVTLMGDKVAPAQEGDRVLGVVSHTYGILGGDSFSCWEGRYLKDEWGRQLWEDVEDPDNPGELVRARTENPDYDHSRSYVERSDRPDEWTPVGLLGQVLVRVTGAVLPGDSVAAGNSGVGVPSDQATGLRCLSIQSEYDEGRGYAIAKCLINVRV